MRCRFCKSKKNYEVINLGKSPVANDYLNKCELHLSETWWPLCVVFCEDCFLVQTVDESPGEKYFRDDYAYFSSYSVSWVSHAKDLVDYSLKKFLIQKEDFVVEVAANDGYLLQFVKDKGFRCLGIEPTLSTALAAEKKGIEIVKKFFNKNLAMDIRKEKGLAKLIFANNVLAHVPDLNDFLKGFEELLSDDGVAIFEFAHVLELIKNKQFDTIYHEHYSYLSLLAVEKIFQACNLDVFDVETINTHGGSLRVFAQKISSGKYLKTDRLRQLRSVELDNNLNIIDGYKIIQSGANKIKINTLEFLITQVKKNKTIVAYGAAAKGNTFLNYLGVSNDLIKFVVDKSPSKIGKYLPGSNIPIVSEEQIIKIKPDYIILLPWNLKTELSKQLSYVKKWGCKLVVAVPELELM